MGETNQLTDFESRSSASASSPAFILIESLRGAAWTAMRRSIFAAGALAIAGGLFGALLGGPGDEAVLGFVSTALAACWLGSGPINRLKRRGEV